MKFTCLNLAYFGMEISRYVTQTLGIVKQKPSLVNEQQQQKHPESLDGWKMNFLFLANGIFFRGELVVSFREGRISPVRRKYIADIMDDNLFEWGSRYRDVLLHEDRILEHHFGVQYVTFTGCIPQNSHLEYIRL